MPRVPDSQRTSAGWQTWREPKSGEWGFVYIVPLGKFGYYDDDEDEKESEEESEEDNTDEDEEDDDNDEDDKSSKKEKKKKSVLAKLLKAQKKSKNKKAKTMDDNVVKSLNKIFKMKLKNDTTDNAVH